MLSSFKTIFQSRYSPTLCFILGLFLFFLPFAELKCKTNKPPAGFSISEKSPPVIITGIGMMTGSVQNAEKYQLSKGENVLNGWIKSVPFAIVAFCAGLIGFVFSVIDFKERPIAIVVTGILSAICLMVVRFTFVTNLDPGLHLLNARFSNMVEVKFTLWFYLSMATFLVTALMGYMQGLYSLTEEYPGEYEMSF
jgi:Na+/H+-translocating membrane pyrophosphatase